MTSCRREPDVLDAVAAGRLDALEQHLAACEACRETLLVAEVMAHEQELAWTDAALPTADIVWFRAQLKARSEAARLAARPVLLVQAIALACLVGAIVGVLGTSAWWMWSWMSWLSSAASVVASAEGTLAMTSLAIRGILLALAVWLVIAPMAVYLAAMED
jgi:predicted anti-sigma-YlaC factor YlaD